MEDYHNELPSQLNQLQEVLGAITDMMPDRHFIVDEQGIILNRFGNVSADQFYLFTGAAPLSITQLTTEKNAQISLSALNQCISKKEIVTLELSSVLSEIQKINPNVTGPTSKQWFEVRMMPLSFAIDNKKTLIVSVRNITERKLSELKLQELVITDSLTQLYNRRYATDELVRCFQRFKRYRTPVSVLMLDIDFFKIINDSYGHDIGDLVLVELSNFLQKSVRNVDTIARLGGEEFILIMPDVSLKDVQLFCLRLLKNIEKLQIPVGAGSLTLTVSGGLTEFTKEDDSIETVLKRVDIALYRSKNEGRNRITIV